MHPVRIRNSMAGRGMMKGMNGMGRKKGGFFGALMAGAIPLLSSVLPGLIDKIMPRRQGTGRKAGISAPYGGRRGRKGKRRGGKCGGAAFTPGPLA